MSMRSTLYETDKVNLCIYGHDWEIELTPSWQEDIPSLTPDEAEDLAKALIMAARISRNEKWEYPNSDHKEQSEIQKSQI